MIERGIKLKGICTSCNKPKRNLRPGSFTAWIFSPISCKCANSKISKSIYLADLPDKSELEKEHNFFEPRYEVIDLVGRGGMGHVYKAKDTQTDKLVAIKVINKKLLLDDNVSKRFEQEAKASSELEHPNLCKVYEYGKTDSQIPYMVMEYVEGISLDELIESGQKLSVDRVFNIVEQICDGLQYAHKQGLVHRDIKPSNIILDSTDADLVKIIDFGIAKVRASQDRTSRALTETGEIFGSPMYMSPEQCLGISVDKRTDIYSLGCVFCELLTGVVPYPDESPIQVVSHHLASKAHKSKVVKRIAPRIRMLVLKCLEKDVEDRYQSMEELKSDIEHLKLGKRPQYSIYGLKPDLSIPSLIALALGVVPVSLVIYGIWVREQFQSPAIMVALISGLAAVFLIYSVARLFLISKLVTLPYRMLQLINLVELVFIAFLVVLGLQLNGVVGLVFESKTLQIGEFVNNLSDVVVPTVILFLFWMILYFVSKFMNLLGCEIKPYGISRASIFGRLLVCLAVFVCGFYFVQYSYEFYSHQFGGKRVQVR